MLSRLAGFLLIYYDILLHVPFQHEEYSAVMVMVMVVVIVMVIVMAATSVMV